MHTATKNVWLKQILPIVVLLCIAAWLLVSTILAQYTQDVRRSQVQSLHAFLMHLNAMRNWVDRGTRQLAKHTYIHKFLQAPTNADDPQLVNLLNGACSMAEAEVVYLLDAKGNAIATSDRSPLPSLVGHNFAFRKYFQRAIRGKTTCFPAVGAINQSPGFYIASPVYLSPDTPAAGVVVAKVPAQQAEVAFQRFDGPVALITENGVVFLTNQEDWRYKTLPSVTGAERNALKADQTFADAPLQALPFSFEQPMIVWKQQKYSVVKLNIDVFGWQLVSLKPAGENYPFAWIIGSLIAFILVALSLIANRIIIYRNAVLEKSINAATENLQKAHDDLLERTHALEEANHELEAFSSIVAHDLRSPLTLILGYCELLKSSPNTTDPNQIKIYETLYRNGRRMKRIVDDLLLFSRVNTIEIKPHPLDLQKIALDVIHSLQQQNPRENMKVHIDSGMFVQGHEGLIQIVLENLLGNAWKFTTSKACPEIRFDSFEQDGETIFRLYDNGVGFASEDAERVFQPFVRLHSDKEFEGTGLGLSTVRRILERHNGRIWAESQPGQKTFFYFVLPEPPEENTEDQTDTETADAI